MRSKHIIITLGRSGSNTLVDMLNQNPAILNFGEVLGEWMLVRRLQKRVGAFRLDDRSYLNAILTNTTLHYAANMFRTIGRLRHRRMQEIKSMRNIKTVGFKEFSLNFKRYGLSNYLTETPDANVIALTRTNVLERMISNAFLEATGVVASTSRNARESPKSLYLDPHTILDRLEVIERENDELLKMVDVLPDHRLLLLDYSDLYNSEAHTIKVVREVYSFLNVPEITPKVRMQKIVKKNPLEAIENSAEIREVIAASRFAVYLPSTHTDETAD